MTEKAIDIDLDVFSYAEKMPEEQSLLYLRSDTTIDNVFVYFKGDMTNLVTAVLSAMQNNDDLTDVLVSAVNIKKNIFEGTTVFDRFESACEEIAKSFADIHDVEFNGWLHGEVGNKAVFGKDAISFLDVVYDTKTEQPQNVIWKFQDSNEDNYAKFCEWLENNSHYCDSCDSAVEFDEAEWSNDTPVCPYCDKKLEI